MRTGVRIERAAATRARLIGAARALFAQGGYHVTGTPDLVAAAGVTRGALYHHFRDKRDLFEAVFREVARELEMGAAASVAPLGGDPWRQLQEGLQSFLKLIAASQEAQRVLLLDGPVVFGWSRWREIQSEFTFGHLARILDALMERGIVEARPPEPLANLILAALNDAAMAIAHAPDAETVRAQVGDALGVLVAGLKQT